MTTQPAGIATVPAAADATSTGPDPSRLAAARGVRARALRRSHGFGRRRVAERAMRVVDIVGVLMVAPFAFMIVGVAAVAIRLDSPGPAFFRHPRTGRGGRRFTLWKLRTMVDGAEKSRDRLRALSISSGAAFKVRDDPRVTRVGRVLRRSHLDEIPQLWNVLRGDMSLVGPRPTSAPPESYELWQRARLETRPGLTGAWQVCEEKNAIPFEDRVRIDIRYLRGRTVTGDLRLIARTVAEVTHAHGM
jgi:lipopolysaccharide/colanic/teichoic acid biosynthesis glycosyltransferase